MSVNLYQIFELLKEQSGQAHWGSPPPHTRAQGIQSLPFLSDRVFLSVPIDSKLSELKSISLKDIPAQPLLYPQIGGHFLAQIETIIDKNKNDGTHRTLIPMTDPELNVTYHISFLKANRKKLAAKFDIAETE